MVRPGNKASIDLTKTDIWYSFLHCIHNIPIYSITDLCRASISLPPSVWVQLLDRRQRHLKVFVLSVDAFLPHDHPPSEYPSPYLLWEDTSEHWINVRATLLAQLLRQV